MSGGRDAGQALVQHALLLAAIVVLCVGALAEVQANAHGLFARVASSIAAADPTGTTASTTAPVTTTTTSKGKKTKH